MSLLVVGSIALDSVQTPAGRVTDAVGGSATFFSAAASLFHPVQLVGVVGADFPIGELDFLNLRGVDFSGLQHGSGESFRWSGIYSEDLNDRETLETRLGVLATFQPKIPEHYRSAEWVFLGNLDPEHQIEVLDQLDRPRLVGCDTMNFWIETKRDALLELLKRVDLLLLNDSEARQLSGHTNLLHAARWIRERGPASVVIKKGEHGAVLVTPDAIFFAPGFPIEEIRDPTGAGDAFAGGFLGYLARIGSASPESLRCAMMYGSATGSFAVENFGLGRLKDLTREETDERVGGFLRMTAFEHRMPANAHG